jgi:hypothetical protein
VTPKHDPPTLRWVADRLRQQAASAERDLDNPQFAEVREYWRGYATGLRREAKLLDLRATRIERAKVRATRAERGSKSGGERQG